MKKNLILTGWYYPEYLAAAAAVYGHYKGAADVLGVSMAELAGVLDTKGGGYETIDILGVGLTERSTSWAWDSRRTWIVWPGR